MRFDLDWTLVIAIGLDSVIALFMGYALVIVIGETVEHFTL